MPNPIRQSKRPATIERQRPCPKRFKKPLALIQERNNPGTSAVQFNSSQQKSSESILENDMLMNVSDDSSSVRSASDAPSVEHRSIPTRRSYHELVSLSSKEMSNQQTVASDVPSENAESHQNKSSVRNQSRLQNDSESLCSDVLHSSNRQVTVQTINTTRRSQRDTINQGTVQSPAAPAVRNPRLRQPNNNLAQDIRQFFSEDFNVSNYSRSLAG